MIRRPPVGSTLSCCGEQASISREIMKRPQTKVRPIDEMAKDVFKKVARLLPFIINVEIVCHVGWRMSTRDWAA